MEEQVLFVKGTDWVCRPKEWDSMPDRFDNTWGVVRVSSESSIFISYYLVSLCILLSALCFLAQVRPQITDEQEASFDELGRSLLIRGSGRTL